MLLAESMIQISYIAGLSVKCTACHCKVGFLLETIRLTSKVYQIIGKVH